VTDILTTHTGSLLRPDDLLEFLAAVGADEPYDVDAFEACAERAVKDVVRRQLETGLDVINDGELGRISWFSYNNYGRLGGVEARNVPLSETANNLPPTEDYDVEAYAEYYGMHDGVLHAEYVRNRPDPLAPVRHGSDDGLLWACTGPLTYNPTPLNREIARLKKALEGIEVKGAFITAVAPASEEFYLRNEYYSSDEEFMYAIADALHEEYRAIVDAGFVLQIDDPILMDKYEPMIMQGQTVSDYLKWAELRVAAVNRALTGLPQDRVRFHMCPGSTMTPHMRDTPLTVLLKVMFAINAGAYLFEQANAAHEHEWHVWENVSLPDDKILIPGFVTHKTPVVEHPQLVADRIVRMARIVGPERLMAGVDCGFAQNALVARVPAFTQWAKLRALVEGAKLAGEQLRAGQKAAS
jgi:5-methyltetrahydropteroyltriglutamate--homocysteine methyltransferase